MKTIRSLIPPTTIWFWVGLLARPVWDYGYNATQANQLAQTVGWFFVLALCVVVTSLICFLIHPKEIEKEEV